MNGRIDVIEVLRLANPVPPKSIDHPVRLTAERRGSLRGVPSDVPVTWTEAAPARRRRVWPKYAASAVAVAAGLAAFVLVPRSGDPVTTPDKTTPVATESPTSAVPTSAVPTSTAPGASLWMELASGSTAPLPAAPIPALNGSAVVWTGTEVIVWGGLVDDGSCCSYSHDGAAFDPTAGTWRQIAPPPDGVANGVVVWTGSEMIVFSSGNPDTVSAAYDPATNTWRLITNPPVPGSVALWIGDAVVFLGDVEDPGGVVSGSGFAYAPATDVWRRLADGPWGLPATWTGTTIIVVTDTDAVTGTRLAGYDPATDTWRVLEGVHAGDQPVVLPDQGGAAAIVALLSGAAGTPVGLLDDRGNAIGELAGRPEELASSPCLEPPGNTGCIFVRSARATAVGGEVLVWYGEDGWAFDPAAQTWRSLALDGRRPTWDGTEVVAAGDLLFVWGAGRDGLVYRAATPGCPWHRDRCEITA